MFIVPLEPKILLSSFRSGRLTFRSSGALADDVDEAINIALLHGAANEPDLRDRSVEIRSRSHDDEG